MDLVMMTYYAAICGILGLASPQVRNPAVRFLVGLVVGLAAARVAPLFHGLFGPA